MSPIPRIVSASVASTAAIGLIVAIGVVPLASAEPCSPPEANVEPPPASPAVPPGVTSPSPSGQFPRGHAPRGADDRAPLPRRGAVSNPNSRQSAPLRQQAAVAPPRPNPPGAANQPPPNVAQPNPPNAAEAVPPAPDVPDPGAALGGSQTSLVDWVSGPDSPNRTLERFGISGTDLGIMWDNGDPVNRQVLMAFGDTTGYCSVQGHQWRYNVMFRSPDRDLSDGIKVADGVVGDKYSGSPVWAPGLSKQLINSIRRAPEETSIIPTAGIAVGKTQYVHFMSVRDWIGHGDWSTNFSAVAMSPDNGEHWGMYPASIRTPAPDSIAGAHHVPGNENFQQAAFLHGNDGYVYSFGTPAGRSGAAYMARVPHNAVPDVSKYQYWNSDRDGWVPGDPSAATPVFPGPVGEMSVQYNSYLKQYLTLYSKGADGVVARTAPAPQGPWSPEHMLVNSFQMPGGIYAPYLHPWSTGKDVYFNLSLWSVYNVMLMHTELG
jgi:hypothetical protein